MLNIPDSERLIYRFLTQNDTDLLFDLDQDPEVMKYINGGKVSTMEDLTQVMLPRMASYADQSKGWGLWGVFTKDNAAFIGWILVRPMDFFSDNPKWQDLELGWRFKQSSWGKGYATEAAIAVKNTLETTQQITHFTALAFPDNQGSINIMKKLGMTYVKTDIHKDPLGDDEVVYYQQSIE
ncbi:GNAT family N-acetyltransferase [Marinicella rhabdoformis]|uniref:GNAT family N-acetyltransferase n=1 Tax=Marinicella rhabdoformis TaxID=2580566 RepID=UPI0012AED71A|nr:GNAT family N-acetyltransferase [Marinicella rhabdoformis]